MIVPVSSLAARPIRIVAKRIPQYAEGLTDYARPLLGGPSASCQNSQSEQLTAAHAGLSCKPVQSLVVRSSCGIKPSEEGCQLD